MAATITPGLMASPGSEAFFVQLEVCRAVAHSSWCSGSSPNRGWGSHRLHHHNLWHGGIQKVIPLHQGFKASVDILDCTTEYAGGTPQTTQCTIAGPCQSHHLVSSYHLDVPENLGSGRWGRQEILASQAGQARWGFQQLDFFLSAVGSLKAIACFWASSST